MPLCAIGIIASYERYGRDEILCPSSFRSFAACQTRIFPCFIQHRYRGIHTDGIRTPAVQDTGRDSGTPPISRNSMISAGLNIAFIHPDLGLGGAERLIVDAATELVKHGHSVDLYTAYYDPQRCFEETRGPGGFRVIVAGGWFPRHILGRCVALCAYVRCILAALYVVWVSWTQPRTTIKAGPWLRQPCYDVIIADQAGGGRRVPFLCVPGVWVIGSWGMQARVGFPTGVGHCVPFLCAREGPMQRVPPLSSSHFGLPQMSALACPACPHISPLNPSPHVLAVLPVLRLPHPLPPCFPSGVSRHACTARPHLLQDAVLLPLPRHAALPGEGDVAAQGEPCCCPRGGRCYCSRCAHAPLM